LIDFSDQVIRTMPDCRTNIKAIVPGSVPIPIRRARFEGEIGMVQILTHQVSAHRVSIYQVSRFHPLLVALHWTLAFLIPAALALGALVMVKIPNSDPMKVEALRSHMIGGSLILLLMLIRFLVRATTTHPAAASTGKKALDWLAWASHRMLYGAVLVMAGSGVVMALQAGLPAIVFGGEGVLPGDFWVFPVRTAHYVASRVLMGLIALHVAGALYHTLVLRDGLLRRMFFGRRVPAEAEPTPLLNAQPSGRQS
jgi:cytochrome b561